jgi:hypothetical protein
MSNRVVAVLTVAVGLAVSVVVAWGLWLGWTRRTYEVGEVVGLVVTLAVLVVAVSLLWLWIAPRLLWLPGVATVLAVTVGITGSTAAAWSSDTTGLWAVGAFMVFIGTLIGTSLVVLPFELVRQRRRRRLDRRSAAPLERGEPCP